MDAPTVSLQFMLKKAMQAFQIGNFNSADLALKEILQKNINSSNTVFELGIAYANSNKLAEALAIFNCLQTYREGDAKIPYNLGLLHSLQGNHQLALEAYNLALKIQPDFLEALINIGSTYNDIKNFNLALDFLQKAIQIKPDIPEAWSNLGITLNHLNLYQESLSAYCEAIKLNPQYYEAWSNKSVVLNKLRLLSEAFIACNHALRLKPDYAEAWCNKGNVLNELKRYDEAIAHYERALSIKPDIDWLHGSLLHTRMKICHWSDLTELLSNISKRIVAGEKVAQPFLLLALNDDPSLHRKSSEIYINSKHPFNPALGPIPKYPANQKIRLGYFSADFHNHATGYLIAELFELHDKGQFELFGFSFGPATGDEMRQRLKKSFDQFIDVSSKTDIEIAKLSRDLNIDIAIDLKGFTEDSRTGIFAYQAAPIQVNYLGYPGTMGADYIDYIVADQNVIPPELQKYYSEKIAYIPNSYQANDRKRAIAKKQFKRQELNLPNQGFVFCCFNSSFKILPETFASWMRILNAVEGSVLWLFQDNPWVIVNLKRAALSHGIDPKRLIFAEQIPPSEHLARHYQADLFLDTWPYNAHTTTSDALWTGLPVVTLAGQSFASRVAASLLTAIGLPELITRTQKEYETLAINLAKDPQKLSIVKQTLISHRLTTPLFDTPSFTKNLEALYIRLHKRNRVELQPKHIY